MHKLTIAVAALVALASSSAMAKDTQVERKAAASGQIHQMSDAEMEGVTAGYSTDNNGSNGGAIGYGGGNGNASGLGAYNKNYHGRFFICCG